ncbi:hypothetical protein C8R44DRAFT_852388 [Mycena epipterygia]|nr:hypothetical protein C8R44DRAFT_852388 [Mycena epipterygia]
MSASSTAALPIGCSNYHFPGFNFTTSNNFSDPIHFAGCITGQPSVLLTCCAKVGSTPVFANNTCGCPFNAAFNLTTGEDIFGTCAIDNNGSATCGPQTVETSAAELKALFRWNSAIVVLGFALLLGAVGV